MKVGIEEKVYLDRDILNQCYRLFFLYTDYTSRKKYVSYEISTKEINPNEVISSPGIRLNEDAAQQLMDQLWIAGVRPSKALKEPINEAQVSKQIEWLQEHLSYLIKK